ncbi:MAG TPA: helix-turn-helix transcriptional regulator [Streptosporangiaceae bacterium]
MSGNLIAQTQDETGAQSLLQMRRALGRQLAAMRNRAGLSQWDLAPLTGYSRSTLSDAELGRHRLRREFWLRCDGLLKGEGRLVASYDSIESAGAVLRQQSGHTAQQTRDQLVSARLRAVRPFPEPAPTPPDPTLPTPAPPDPARPDPAPPAAAQPPSQPQPQPHTGSRVAMEACPHCQRPIAVLIVPSAQT